MDNNSSGNSNSVMVGIIAIIAIVVIIYLVVQAQQKQPTPGTPLINVGTTGGAAASNSGY